MRDHHSEIVRQLEAFGAVGAREAINQTADEANEEAAMLAERLPVGAPDDILLVTSPPLLTEVQRKLVETFGYTPEEAAQRRFSLAAITTFPVPDFELASLDRLSPDRADDFLIHTAFEGRADAVVTDEGRLLVAGEATEYSRLDGRTTLAFSFDGFAETIESSIFSLDAIPELLSVQVTDVRPPTVDLAE